MEINWKLAYLTDWDCDRGTNRKRGGQGCVALATNVETQEENQKGPMTERGS